MTSILAGGWKKGSTRIFFTAYHSTSPLSRVVRVTRLFTKMQVVPSTTHRARFLLSPYREIVPHGFEKTDGEKKKKKRTN